MALHALVPPTKCAKAKSKEVWKFSIVDSQESFLSFYESVAERDENVKCMIDKNKRYGLSTGLYLTMVGNTINDAQIQVTYDEITHLFNDILHAIDCAFKIIMVFRLTFQPQSLNFWHLFQGCFSDTQVEGQMAAVVREHIQHIRKNIYDDEL